MKHLKTFAAGAVVRLAVFGLFYLVSVLLVSDSTEQFALVATLAAFETYLVGKGVLT